MRGLMQKPQKITGAVGEIIESPIISNFTGPDRPRVSSSPRTAAMSLADTALKTADAGYLTRRLVDVAHDVVVVEEDCGTINGIRITAIKSGEDVIEPLEERLVGRFPPDESRTPTARFIAKADEMITAAQAKAAVKAGVERVRLRSPLTCETGVGVCTKCYGLNLATGRLVEIGEAVGVIAAQSIGEPGTQQRRVLPFTWAARLPASSTSPRPWPKVGTVKLQNMPHDQDPRRAGHVRHRNAAIVIAGAVREGAA